MKFYQNLEKGQNNKKDRKMNLSGSVKINKCGMLIISLCGIILLYYILFSNSNMSRHRRPYAFIMRNPDEVNLRKLLIGGIQAAQMGGLQVVYASNDIQAKSKGQTKEGANDPLTNADLRSHCVMENGLKRLFSKVTIISEEDSQLNDCRDSSHFELDPTVIEEDIPLPDDYLISANDITVWIDPLDATQEYTGILTSFNPISNYKFNSIQIDRIPFPICDDNGLCCNPGRASHWHNTQSIYTKDGVGMERCCCFGIIAKNPN